MSIALPVSTADECQLFRRELLKLELWADVVAVVQESLVPAAATGGSSTAIKYHLNQYAVSTDELGLGAFTNPARCCALLIPTAAR